MEFIQNENDPENLFKSFFKNNLYLMECSIFSMKIITHNILKN